jgi:hypothetical protein
MAMIIRVRPFVQDGRDLRVSTFPQLGDVLRRLAVCWTAYAPVHKGAEVQFEVHASHVARQGGPDEHDLVPLGIVFSDSLIHMKPSDWYRKTGCSVVMMVGVGKSETNLLRALGLGEVIMQSHDITDLQRCRFLWIVRALDFSISPPDPSSRDRHGTVNAQSALAASRELDGRMERLRALIRETDSVWHEEKTIDQWTRYFNEGAPGEADPLERHARVLAHYKAVEQAVLRLFDEEDIGLPTNVSPRIYQLEQAGARLRSQPKRPRTEGGASVSFDEDM